MRTLITAGIAAGLVAIVHGPARAQSRGQILVSDIKNTIGDMADVWTSPLRGNGRDWLGVVETVGAAAAISPLDDEVDRWAVRHRGDNTFDFLKPVREGGDAFSGRTIAPVAGGVLVTAILIKNQALNDGVWGCVSSYAASSVVRTYVFEELLARTRPDSSHSIQTPPAKQGDQYHFKFPGGSDWGRHSFPGGHFANVASCAAFLTNRFSMHWAAAIPWAVAGGVALGRTLDRRHWLSDEVIGGVLGYATGKEVALRFKRRAEKRAAPSSDDDGPHGSIVLGTDANGARLGWRFVY